MATRDAIIFGMLLTRVDKVRREYRRPWIYCVLAIEPDASDARIAEILAGLRARFAEKRESKKHRRPLAPKPSPSKMAGNGGGVMRRVVRKGNSMS